MLEVTTAKNGNAETAESSSEKGQVKLTFEMLKETQKLKAKPKN
jgi:hypothetical protein